MAATSSPFTKVVVEAMRRLFPEKLADSSFDNTGLLLEAPARQDRNNSVLTTVDLTTAVVDEAIRGKYSVIISYHPPIFRPLKALTLENTQQASLLRCIQAGISVYSPHTAVDASPVGNNEWLADIITRDGSISHDRQVIKLVSGNGNGDPRQKGAGYGRIVTFNEPQTLGTLVNLIRSSIFPKTVEAKDQAQLNVAIPQSVSPTDRWSLPITSVGICAGSGGSILNGVDVDMLFTGELSHHEALAAIEQGRVVVTTFHSNSERAYLDLNFRPHLEKEIQGVIDDPEFKAEFEGLWNISQSKADRDPYVSVHEDDLLEHESK